MSGEEPQVEAAVAEQQPEQPANQPQEAAGAAPVDAPAEPASSPAAATDATDNKPSGKRTRTTKLGYKTFENGNECSAYFKKLLKEAPKGYDLNEVCLLASSKMSSS